MPHKTRKGPHKQDCSRKKTGSNHKSRYSKHWTARLFEIEKGVFKRLIRAVNSPFAERMRIWYESGNWMEIANAPLPDTGSATFPDDYLLQQVMRKNPRLPIAVDRKAVATSKWMEAERACKETNDLIRACSKDYASDASASLAIAPRRLAALRADIKRILGPLSPAVLKTIEDGTRFGPGATFHCAGKDLTPNKRLKARIGLTPSLVKFVGSLEPYGWLTTTSGYALTRGSRACTVPKDAQTDRFIAIEPSLNMRWQLGIGGYLRGRLKRFGLDLDVQADVNRDRVRRAERDLLATIDLSSASDSVALNLVRWLLPPEWVHLLEIFRSPEMLVDGKWVTLEKISSMGNGFTFELETLLFFAVARLFDNDPAVFGDDIIVRQDCASDVIRTLNVFGFSVNGKKTFVAGCFFESCGVDVWRGQDVRPFYLKKGEDETDLTSSIIRMVNSIRRYANRRDSHGGCDSRFLPAWLYAMARDENARHTHIPEGYGDDGIVRDFDDCTPTCAPHGWQGFTGRIWSRRSVDIEVTTELAGMYAALDTSPNHAAVERVPSMFHYREDGSLRIQPIREPTYLGYNYRKAVDFDVYGSQNGRLVPLDLVWRTGGDKASRTYQSVRGRVRKGALQNLLCFSWQGLGPWR